MPVIEFVGQSRKDADFNAAATSRLINCYREPVEDGHAIKSVLGTVAFATLSGIFMRAITEIGGVLVAACGGTLSTINSLGTITALGAVSDGQTTISGNNGQIAVAANGTYYLWTGSALTTPAGGAFSSVGSVEFLNQVTILTELNGRRFMWSGPAAPQTLNGLNFATAEGRDDNIIRCIMINGNLWFLKVKSTEIWYDTGAGYSRVQGGVIDTGLKDFGLVAKLDDGAFLVGDDGIVYLASGTTLTPVSIPAVETDIAQGEPTRCFYYEDEGHKFCVLNFNSRPAWIFDLSTGEWHNRASGTELTDWSMVESAKAFGKWFVGSDTGAVLSLERVNADHDAPLLRRMISRTFRPGEWFTLKRFEIFGRQGESASKNVMLRISGNNGKTWGAERWRTFGAVGEYANRVIWRALGRHRQATAELTISDPVELPIHSMAQVEIA